MPIRMRLLFIALGVAIPLIAATVFIVYQLSKAQTDIQRDAMLGSTRILAALTDAEVETYVGIGQSLAASSSLEANDLEKFYKEAMGSLNGWPDSWLILVSRDGEQLLHTLRPLNEKLPFISDRETFDRAVSQRRWQISDVRTGLVSREFALNLFVPVFIKDQLRYVILIALRPAIFDKLLKKQKLESGWLSGIIDQRGNFIARNLYNDALVGKPASSGWRSNAKKANEGLFENKSLEGEQFYSAFVNSPKTGWSISIAASEQTLAGPFRTSLVIIILCGCVAVTASYFLVVGQSRKITRPLANLKGASAAMVRHEVVALNETGMSEVDDALKAFMTASEAIVERDRQQEESLTHLRLMTNELNHRVKNTLAVIVSLATITSRKAQSVEEYSQTLVARLRSLSRTHDVLTHQSWEAADLREIISSEVATFQDGERARVTLSGADVRLSPKCALDLGMIVHELTTNSAKYGSLSIERGVVNISWFVEGDKLVLEWKEAGGPVVEPPARRGFGSRLIEQVLRSDGSYIPNYAAEGFNCSIIIKLRDAHPPVA